jgi:calcineurin-like phosphoesterase family protein
MDEFMVKAWNERVRPNDKVYHLGDVVINRKFLHILGRLNGDKVLIRGNHDIFKLEDYTPYFRDIRGYDVKNGMIFSHVPVHPESLARFGCNIHGHLHANRVMKIIGVNTKTGEFNYSNEIDPRYFNVSVEQIDFAPIALEEVNKRITEQGGHVGFKHGNQVIM